MLGSKFIVFCLSFLFVKNVIASASGSGSGSRDINKEYNEAKKSIGKIINDKSKEAGTFNKHMQNLNSSIDKMKTLEREASCRNDSNLAKNIRGSVNIYEKVADKYNSDKYKDNKK